MNYNDKSKNNCFKFSFQTDNNLFLQSKANKRLNQKGLASSCSGDGPSI